MRGGKYYEGDGIPNIFGEFPLLSKYILYSITY